MIRSCGVKNAEPDSTVPFGRLRASLVEDETTDIRVDKILEIRRQLGEGTYNIEERLDVVVERIIADLGTV